jgi:hypothetical protein
MLRLLILLGPGRLGVDIWDVYQLRPPLSGGRTPSVELLCRRLLLLLDTYSVPCNYISIWTSVVQHETTTLVNEAPYNGAYSVHRTN